MTSLDGFCMQIVPCGSVTSLHQNCETVGSTSNKLLEQRFAVLSPCSNPLATAVPIAGSGMQLSSNYVHSVVNG